jgi:uncharacterized protein (TIGR02145 family)
MKIKIHTIIFSIIFIFLFISCEEKGPTSPASNNSAPVAHFIATPDTGIIATIFDFDASGCTDKEDSASSLIVRWDWENDGTWDTAYSSIKTTQHQYSTSGTKTINLQVRDSDGLSSTANQQVTVIDEMEIKSGTLTDIDGNKYRTVKIGTQWWMAENLQVTKYSNGDTIPYKLDHSAGSTVFQGAYYNYNNDTKNVVTYGRLYNWYALNDNRKITPEGWHVPSDHEWQVLIDFLGGNAIAGGEIKESGFAHWSSPNTGATNSSGFSALPGGYYIYGGFLGLGIIAHLWSSTEDPCMASDTHFCAHFWSLVNESSSIGFFWEIKRNGYSVRLIKD